MKNKHPVCEQKTPFDKTFAGRSNLKQLNVFGCQSFASMEKEKRKKFDSQAEGKKLLRYSRLGNVLKRFFRGMIFENAASSKGEIKQENVPRWVGNSTAIKIKISGQDKRCAIIDKLQAHSSRSSK